LTVASNRTLGIIGACFTAISAVSSVFTLLQYAFPNLGAANLVFASVGGIIGVLGLVGFILFLIAMHGFSKDYSAPKIFDYILYGFIITIVAAVIVGIIIFAIAFISLASIIPTLNPSTTSPSAIASSMLTYLAPILPAIGAVSLIWVIFNMRAFNLLADKSKVPLFRTAAKVLLAGALLTIVLGIVFAALASYSSITLNTLLIMAVPGGIVQNAAWAILAIAFFRIRATPTPAFTQPTVPPAAGQVKYCPNCGAPNQTDAIYCTRCGQKL
jgi:uncharacterized membrane protein